MSFQSPRTSQNVPGRPPGTASFAKLHQRGPAERLGFRATDELGTEECVFILAINTPAVASVISSATPRACCIRYPQCNTESLLRIDRAKRMVAGYREDAGPAEDRGIRASCVRIGLELTSMIASATRSGSGRVSPNIAIEGSRASRVRRARRLSRCRRPTGSLSSTGCQSEPRTGSPSGRGVDYGLRQRSTGPVATPIRRRAHH